MHRHFQWYWVPMVLAAILLGLCARAIAASAAQEQSSTALPSCPKKGLSFTDTYVENYDHLGPCGVQIVVYNRHGEKDPSKGGFDLYSSAEVTLRPTDPVGKPIPSTLKVVDGACSYEIMLLSGWNSPPVAHLTTYDAYPAEDVFYRYQYGSLNCTDLASSDSSTPTPSSPTPVNITSSTRTAGPQATPTPAPKILPPNTGSGVLPPDTDSGWFRIFVSVVVMLLVVLAIWWGYEDRHRRH